MHSTEYLSSIKDHYKDRSYKNIETTIKKMETESKKLDKELCELTFNELCFGFQIFRGERYLDYEDRSCRSIFRLVCG